ncbi:hypothetical protein ACQ856_30200 (plasmid) [Mycolicibacterium psychrotolerans]|uniref:hypothetical protein n=1 Tax=Mycolicibacterium psychrotolerans TaxID=216929 RepID=UPI003D6734D2
MSLDWAMIGKIALLSFIAVSLIIVAVNYFRRRRSGITPWRPANSLIVGYDAPRPQIEHPAGPSHADGRLRLPDSTRPDLPA